MKTNIESLIEAVIHDNRQHIIAYSNNPYHYFMYDLAAADQAIKWYLADEEIKEYEEGDEATKERFYNEIQELLKKYDYKLIKKRVFKKTHDDEDIYIFDDEQISLKDWSEIYDQYGQKQLDEPQNIESEVIEFHNGHNWQSLVIEDQAYPHPSLKELDPQETRSILEALDGAEFGQYNKGIATAETDNCIFSKSLWQNSYPGIRCEGK